MYAKISFGIMNVGAMFQWDMDIAFTDEKDTILVIYLDDITVLSKYDEERDYIPKQLSFLHRKE